MKNYNFYNEYFDITKILECGQFFNYEKKNNIFILNINNKKINIKTENNLTITNTTKDFFKENLENFFNMNTNYKQLSNEIIEFFPELEKYINFGKGIRFIQQDLLLACISFIISQNNNMKRIKMSINSLIIKYGTNNNFPTLNELKKLSLEDWKNLGVGFRDKYLYNFIQTVDENWINKIKTMNTNEAYEELIKFKGIGPKVTNCILLFGLGKQDVFPVDTHIKQIMQQIYFDNKETKNKDIEEFALKKFKNYSAYIQQCLFYYKINN